MVRRLIMPQQGRERAIGRRLLALGRPCLLLAACCCGLGSFASAADDLHREMKALRAKYTAAVEKLADWCQQQGLADEAAKTRDVLGRRDPSKLYLPILSPEIGPPKPPDGAAPTVVEWRQRLLKLREEQAGTLYDLAQRAIRRRQASLAYQLALDAIRENPDHEGARRVFGYQKIQGQWHTAYEARKLRAGFVWHEKFGWLAKGNVARYEDGQRLAAGRWVSAEDDARMHRDIASGWLIETEHYRIRTNHSIEAAVALSVKLEVLHFLWRQIFIRYYASEAQVEALFNGRGPARTQDSPRFEIVYYRDKESYVRALKPSMPDIGISMGVYIASRRAAYFFADNEDGDRVTFHEATHQLFQQSRRVPDNLGAGANFWVVEGIAMYMESLHREDGHYVLGGLDDPRMQSARHHLLEERFYMPFAEVAGLNMRDLQTHPKIAKLYSQLAAMTSFLVYYDDGRYRDALVAYLSAVYTGNSDPDLLAQLTGTDYAELDRQYREFMAAGQKQRATIHKAGGTGPFFGRSALLSCATSSENMDLSPSLPPHERLQQRLQGE